MRLKGGIDGFAATGALVQRADRGQQRLGESPLLACRKAAGNPPPENERLGAAGRSRVDQLALDGLPCLGNAPIVHGQAITGPEAIAQKIEPASLVLGRLSPARLELREHFPKAPQE